MNDGASIALNLSNHQPIMKNRRILPYIVIFCANLFLQLVAVAAEVLNTRSVAPPKTYQSMKQCRVLGLYIFLREF